VRRQFFGDEGPPVYSGVNMWRGTTVWEPFLSGSTYLRAGWLTVGKMVIYPVRHNVDGQGRQLVNWVAEVQTDQYNEQDWNRTGRLEDFYDVFADWTFDWLDVAGLIKGAEQILEYPMVDRDPLPRWTHGRVTLLGDAAHPMYQGLQRRGPGHPRRPDLWPTACSHTHRWMRRCGPTRSSGSQPPQRWCTPADPHPRTSSSRRSTSEPATGRSSASPT